MSWINQIMQQLFGKEEEVSKTPSRQPVVHEVIQRTHTDKDAYQRWLGSQRMQRALDFIQLEYNKNRHEENLVGATFYHLNQPSSKGFILNYRKDMFSEKEFQYYFDYLKERVLTLDYKSYTSDLRSYDRGEYVETIERHYLKPSWRMTADKSQLVQQYGNITITHHSKDDQPVYLKFMCHNYADRQFTDAEDFEQLIQHMIH